MTVFYVCDPKRNTQCTAVVRVEKNTVACLNNGCQSTTNRRYARRVVGVPLINIKMTLAYQKDATLFSGTLKDSQPIKIHNPIALVDKMNEKQEDVQNETW